MSDENVHGPETDEAVEKARQSTERKPRRRKTANKAAAPDAVDAEILERVRATEDPETRDLGWDDLTQEQREARGAVALEVHNKQAAAAAEEAASEPPVGSDDTIRETPEPEAGEFDEALAAAAEKIAREPWAIYGGGPGPDSVFASRIVFQNSGARNSLSVLHMQRALKEQGYEETLRDRGGFYSNGTAEALARFKDDHDLLEDEDLYIVLRHLFDGDVNVALHR